jgi:hypothetical protein
MLCRSLPIAPAITAPLAAVPEQSTNRAHPCPHSASPTPGYQPARTACRGAPPRPCRTAGGQVATLTGRPGALRSLFLTATRETAPPRTLDGVAAKAFDARTGRLAPCSGAPFASTHARRPSCGLRRRGAGHCPASWRAVRQTAPPGTGEVNGPFCTAGLATDTQAAPVTHACMLYVLRAISPNSLRSIRPLAQVVFRSGSKQHYTASSAVSHCLRVD